VLTLFALIFVAAAPSAAPPVPAAPGGELPTLTVRELTEPGASAAPSARARALSARRVRLVGFMVRQEEEQPGGFWLAPRPVECDEGGAGTGDLPPGSVRVIMAEPPAPIDGPIAVTGLLEVGTDAGAEGPATTLRLRIDRPATTPSPKP
jgi:hypothetical protein